MKWKEGGVLVSFDFCMIVQVLFIIIISIIIVIIIIYLVFRPQRRELLTTCSTSRLTVQPFI